MPTCDCDLQVLRLASQFDFVAEGKPHSSVLVFGSTTFESNHTHHSVHFINAPIFRLLLKVAVKGTHQCDFLNF
jgi:hypothetical protein